jgi:hypothetical protein
VSAARWVGIARVFLAYPYPLPKEASHYHVFEWRTDPLLADLPLFVALAALTLGRPRERQILLYASRQSERLAAYGFARNAWIA